MCDASLRNTAGTAVGPDGRCCYTMVPSASAATATATASCSSFPSSSPALFSSSSSSSSSSSPASSSSSVTMPENGNGGGEGKGPTFACGLCLYSTDRKNNLKRHTLTMHEVSLAPLECCGLRFLSKADLRMHTQDLHRNGYYCGTCRRVFCRKALLKRHSSVHSGYKEFSCRLCAYRTSHKSNLERHMRTHQKKGAAPPPAAAAHSQGLTASHHHHQQPLVSAPHPMTYYYYGGAGAGAAHEYPTPNGPCWPALPGAGPLTPPAAHAHAHAPEPSCAFGMGGGERRAPEAPFQPHPHAVDWPMACEGDPRPPAPPAHAHAHAHGAVLRPRPVRAPAGVCFGPEAQAPWWQPPPWPADDDDVVFVRGQFDPLTPPEDEGAPAGQRRPAHAGEERDAPLNLTVSPKKKPPEYVPKKLRMSRKFKDVQRDA